MSSRSVHALAVALALFFQGARVSGQSGAATMPKLMTPADLQALPMLPTDHRLAYGDDPRFRN